MSMWVRSTRRGREHSQRELRRELRGMLVHAAGCTEPNCCTKTVDREDAADLGMVSVPRSLRHRLGRFIGGSR